MNETDIKKPSYSKEEKTQLESAYYRGVSGEVYPKKSEVIVRISLRTIGIFKYRVEEDSIELVEYRTIESEFNPLIVAIDTLVQHFSNNKKIKKIVWETK